MTLEQSHGLMESNKEVLIFICVLGSQGRSFSAGEFVSFSDIIMKFTTEKCYCKNTYSVI